MLYQHAWPGNVRELENVISCACLTSVNEFIDVDDLPENLQKPAAQIGRAGETWRPLPLEESGGNIFAGYSRPAKAIAFEPLKCLELGGPACTGS